MRVIVRTESGDVTINDFEIKTFIATQIQMIPGVYALADKTVISKFLRMLQPEYVTGVEVAYMSGNRVGISIDVILKENMNFIQVTNSIQDIIKYSITKKYGLKVKFVDVYVKGIVSEEVND